MAIKNQIIKKKIEFINVHRHGKIFKSNSLIIQKLFDKKLNNSLKLGYKVTKKLGNAVKRNKAKRIMRDLVRRNMSKYGKNNFLYILTAKKELFKTPFKDLEQEFIKLLTK